MTIRKPNVIVVLPDGTWDTSASVRIVSDAEMARLHEGEGPEGMGREIAAVAVSRGSGE